MLANRDQLGHNLNFGETGGTKRIYQVLHRMNSLEIRQSLLAEKSEENIQRMVKVLRLVSLPDYGFERLNFKITPVVEGPMYHIVNSDLLSKGTDVEPTSSNYQGDSSGL